MEVTFTLDPRELTKERVLALFATEAWQKAFADHVLLTSYCDAGKRWPDKHNGQEIPGKPTLGDAVRWSSKTFKGMYLAIQAAGFTIEPWNPNSEAEDEAVIREMTETLSVANMLEKILGITPPPR